MDSDASFGYWLTRRRKALHLSRVELARRVCCAAITLRKIEEDARRPSQQIATKLAEHLAVSGAEAATFIRVARGELPIEWLPPAERPATPDPATNTHRSNIAIPPTPLIGRAAEVAAVCALLRQDDLRLLTLTGAPGIGKTRLGLQVAAELRNTFADGVWLIALAPLRDANLVLTAIAQTLGIAERAGVALLDRLTVYLRDRQMLLILDNFEHVLAAAPQLAALLALAPQLTLLVTSRVALRLAGEQRYPVPPLPLPPTTDDRPSDTAQGERLTTDDAPSEMLGRLRLEIGQSAAVQLFVQRARTVHPHFALTDTNAAAIAAICVRLDGLPLAIELAATRVNLFTPQELLTRLAQRFALLTAGALDLPPHQQTLRRAIDWSYALLDAAERTLFRRLSVFVGSWTLAAAAAVAELRIENAKLKTSAAPGQFSIFNSQFSIFDGLAALVDHSLVRREEGSNGESRLSMLETIREYARECLAQSGELAATQQQHLDYYLALAEQAEPQLAAADQLLWLDRLEQDHDNLRIALAWAIVRQPEVALQLAGALAEFWDMRSYHSEGRRWLDQVLDLRFAILDLAPAHQANSQHPTSAIARALQGAGRLAHAQEDNLRAQLLFTEGLALARALGDPNRIALLLSDLSELALHQGDMEHATALCAEGLALARAADDRSAIARLLLGRGELAVARGDWGDAAACYTESLVLHRAINDRRGIAWALHVLGNLALAERAGPRAAELFAEGLALAREIGDRENTAWLLYHTGLLALEQHDLASATARFVEGARLLHVLGAGQGVALNLVGLATAMIQHQDLTQAARLLSVAEAQHRVAGAWWVAADQATYDCAVATVRERLDAAAFDTIWAEARTITLEQALTTAMEY